MEASPSAQPGPSVERRAAPRAITWTHAQRAEKLLQQERMERLARTIESEIIPRLVLSHHHRGGQPSDPHALAPAGSDVTDFVALLRSPTPGAAADHVKNLQASGLALDRIYLELLTPAARLLGTLWEADTCDFTEVTLGLWRLHQVVMDLSAEFMQDAPVPNHSRRALLAASPGSTHTFGVVVLGEFFRRAGWDTVVESQAKSAELQDKVHRVAFDVVGISVSTEGELARLPALILGLRRASRNPDLRVLVGGPVFQAGGSALAAQAGADACAADARQALQDAESLLTPRTATCIA